jgi:hypothetical protein
MKLGNFLSIGVLLGGLLAASTAAAATCASRDAVVERLQFRFGEANIANSISRSNNVLEIFAKPNVDSWTVLLTLPERQLTCLVATGHGETQLEAFLQRL